MDKSLFDQILELGISEEQLRTAEHPFDYLSELLLSVRVTPREEELDWEFKSIEGLARQSLISTAAWLPQAYEGPRDFRHLMRSAARRFANEINMWALFADEGLPLYALDDDGFQLAGSDDPNRQFLFLSAGQGHILDESCNTAPPWASYLYVNRDAMLIHDLMWGEESPGSGSEARLARVEATQLLMAARGVHGFAKNSVASNDHKCDDPKWPEELDIATIAWETARSQCPAGVRPGKFIRDWLSLERPHLSAEAINRIATVANWDKSPGPGRRAPHKQD